MILLAVALAVSSAGSAVPAVSPEWTPHAWPTPVPAATAPPRPTATPNAEAAAFVITLDGMQRGLRGDQWGEVSKQPGAGFSLSAPASDHLALHVFGSYTSDRHKDTLVEIRGSVLDFGLGGQLLARREGGFVHAEVGAAFVRATVHADSALTPTFSDNATATGIYFGGGFAFKTSGDVIVGAFIRRNAAYADLFKERVDVGGITIGVSVGFSGTGG